MMEGEMKEKRKIQFSVPSAVPTQLDPKQVEMIRRRRPTPATLFRLTDHPSPEEENPSHQLAVCENGVLKVKRVNTAVYQPPSLKAVQKMVEAHMQSSETGHNSHSSESSDNEEVCPDPDRVPPGDTRTDHSALHSATGFMDENSNQRDASGEEDEGMAETKEGLGKSADNGKIPKMMQSEMSLPKADPGSHFTEPTENNEAALNTARGPPDGRSEQSEHPSVPEDAHSTLHPRDANKETEIGSSAGKADNGGSKEKGED